MQWILSPLYGIVFGQSADAASKTNNKVAFPDAKLQEQEMIDDSLANDNDPKGKLCSTGTQEGSIAMFQMPLHYPRYKKADYEKMEEWKLDMLLKEYGLNFKGSLEEKRKFAMGTFLWPDQF